jgi:hypothetical protein
MSGVGIESKMTYYDGEDLESSFDENLCESPERIMVEVKS